MSKDVLRMSCTWPRCGHEWPGCCLEKSEAVPTKIEPPKRITPETLASWPPKDGGRPWRWRNLRGLCISGTWVVFPWDWTIGAVVMTNTYLEFAAGISFGPVQFDIHADIGNCSSKNWLRAKMGLSESEAWDRSA